MIAADNVIQNILCIALSIYWYILIAYVLISWAFTFGMRRPYSGPGATLLDALDAVVLPVIRPLGRLIPPVRFGAVGIDLSVIVAFVILSVLRVAICR